MPDKRKLQSNLNLMLKRNLPVAFCIGCIFLILTTSSLWAAEDSSAEQMGRVRYGIDCESLDVSRAVLRPHQNLAKILLQHNVPYSIINKLASKSKDVFDVRKMKAGNPYCLISDPASGEGVRYLVYEKNPVDYVVFKLENPVDVYSGGKKVETRTKAAAGIIESSLWKTLSRQDLSHKLAVRLSELYAWSIDFHHLQKRDSFKVIFEEKYSGGEPLGPGKILAAKFQHKNQDFYAFYFDHADAGGYYDQDADSLRKAFLMAPVKYSRISSRFSKKRLHPILNRYRPHLGTDYVARAGTPIISVGDGVVSKAGYQRECGKYVKIRHNGIYGTQYLHMSRIAKGIKPGKRVKQGEVIGYVGSSGLATSPHVDFRLWKNGKLVDPFKENLPDADPLDDKYIQSFKRRVRELKQRLDSIDFPKHSA
jgi:murein DD-endopeptidase MepM/ murein hydrolase activator NlpD